MSETGIEVSAEHNLSPQKKFDLRSGSTSCVSPASSDVATPSNTKTTPQTAANPLTMFSLAPLEDECTPSTLKSSTPSPQIEKVEVKIQNERLTSNRESAGDFTAEVAASVSRVSSIASSISLSRPASLSAASIAGSTRSTASVANTPSPSPLSAASSSSVSPAVSANSNEPHTLSSLPPLTLSYPSAVTTLTNAALNGAPLDASALSAAAAAYFSDAYTTTAALTSNPYANAYPTYDANSLANWYYLSLASSAATAPPTQAAIDMQTHAAILQAQAQQLAANTAANNLTATSLPLNLNVSMDPNNPALLSMQTTNMYGGNPAALQSFPSSVVNVNDANSAAVAQQVQAQALLNAQAQAYMTQLQLSQQHQLIQQQQQLQQLLIHSASAAAALQQPTDLSQFAALAPLSAYQNTAPSNTQLSRTFAGNALANPTAASRTYRGARYYPPRSTETQHRTLTAHTLTRSTSSSAANGTASSRLPHSHSHSQHSHPATQQSAGFGATLTTQPTQTQLLSAPSAGKAQQHAHQSEAERQWLERVQKKQTQARSWPYASPAPQQALSTVQEPHAKSARTASTGQSGPKSIHTSNSANATSGSAMSKSESSATAAAPASVIAVGGVSSNSAASSILFTPALQSVSAPQPPNSTSAAPSASSSLAAGAASASSALSSSGTSILSAAVSPANFRQLPHDPLLISAKPLPLHADTAMAMAAVAPAAAIVGTSPFKATHAAALAINSVELSASQAATIPDSTTLTDANKLTSGTDQREDTNVTSGSSETLIRPACAPSVASLTEELEEKGNSVEPTCVLSHALEEQKQQKAGEAVGLGENESINKSWSNAGESEGAQHVDSHPSICQFATDVNVVLSPPSPSVLEPSLTPGRFPTSPGAAVDTDSDTRAGGDDQLLSKEGKPRPHLAPSTAAATATLTTSATETLLPKPLPVHSTLKLAHSADIAPALLTKSVQQSGSETKLGFPSGFLSQPFHVLPPQNGSTLLACSARLSSLQVRDLTEEERAQALAALSKVSAKMWKAQSWPRNTLTQLPQNLANNPSNTAAISVEGRTATATKEFTRDGEMLSSVTGEESNNQESSHAEGQRQANGSSKKSAKKTAKKARGKTANGPAASILHSSSTPAGLVNKSAGSSGNANALPANNALNSSNTPDWTYLSSSAVDSAVKGPSGPVSVNVLLVVIGVLLLILAILLAKLL